MENNVSDKRTAVVTGASRGIGRRLASEFARSGYRVGINFNKSREEAESLLKEIESYKGSAFLCGADVSDAGQVDRMISEIKAEEGKIDVIVNNAAICRHRTILKMSEAEWDEVVKTDLYGPFYVMRACAKIMAKQKHGSIVNIGSIAGARGVFGGGNYSSAKGGLTALTKTAAKELGRFGITVNAVLPGFHLTDMGRDAPDDVIESIRNESVLQTTTDINGLAKFVVLLSEQRTVSGQVFNWDSRIT
ncbi:MAG: SDR family NAD(P)-dependent oxidoreductase [Endomicrobiales bacterium]|nr:SDR family NAD(P)-dependent oxidoreductase [Endomicrobiales bacterium]